MCQALTATAEDKAFKRRCQVVCSSALVIYITCSQASLRMHTGFTGTLLAAIAGAAFFTELVSVGFLVVRIRDEFQRILLTRSFLWATAATMALATIWGFVELHEHSAAPHLPLVMIPITLVVLTALAKVVVFRQHRSPSE